VQTFDVVVVGDANPDVVVGGGPDRLEFGQAEHEVGSAALTLGGSGAIAAHACARLGLRTAFVGLVGTDRAGDLVLDILAAAGVDTSSVVRSPGLPTALTVVLTRPDGDRAILTAPGALSAFGPEHVDLSVIEQARFLHVSALFLQPRLAAGLPALLQVARATGTTTSLDTNDDPTGRWALPGPALLALVDYLLPNAREAAALSGHDVADPVRAARALAGQGPRVVVKCGGEGAVAVDGARVLRARLGPPERGLVDTVGAGDAFDAGLLYGLADGRGLPDAMRLAVATGRLSTRAPGGIEGQPTAAEAEQLAATAMLDVDR
jgi:sugar/nucleoside kinase (ribokinase family)